MLIKKIIVIIGVLQVIWQTEWRHPSAKMSPSSQDKKKSPILISFYQNYHFVRVICHFILFLEFKSSVWQREAGRRSVHITLFPIHNSNHNLSKLHMSRCTHLSWFVNYIKVKVKATYSLLIGAERDWVKMFYLTNKLGCHHLLDLWQNFQVHTKTAVRLNSCVNYCGTGWQVSTFKVSHKYLVIDKDT